MKNKIIIISPYPENGTYSHTQSALASFNLNIINELKKSFHIAVFGDTQNTEQNVQKVWQKNNPTTYISLFLATLKQPQITNYLIQFEWGVFGRSIVYVVFFPLFLLFLKLFGKKTTVVLHGVSTNFEPIYGNTVKSKLLNWGSFLFHFLLGLVAHKIIVTEEYFRTLLEQILTLKGKVLFIPHGVDTHFSQPKKEEISEPMKLSFLGFLHEYKGPKELLDLYLTLDHNRYKLTYYGGSNISNSYIDAFRKQAKKNNVEVTGFVPENKMSEVFHNTDIALFPYPSFISSSGMLSFCFTYEQPFLLSINLKNYFKSADLQAALSEAKLQEADLLFELTPESLNEKLSWAQSHINQLRSFTSLVKTKRAWSVIGIKYIHALEENL